MSGSLGEQEMLWEHELHASVSTAFLSSPKLSWLFLFNKLLDYELEISKRFRPHQLSPHRNQEQII